MSEWLRPIVSNPADVTGRFPISFRYRRLYSFYLDLVLGYLS
jgi:hypothetical protein